MAFKYEAYTQSGAKVVGVLETDSEDAAVEMLEQDNLIPYRLEPVRRRRSFVQVMPSLFQPKTQDILDFSKQMASLIRSGIPLRRALIVQRGQTRNLGLREALRQIVEDIESGVRFSDAIGVHTTVFPDYYVRLLRVAEATGGIAFTLDQLADSLQKRKGVRDRIKRALTYPIISLIVAFVAAVILIKFSLPSLIGLLRDFGGELPPITRMLITVSDAVEAYALIGLLVIGLTIAVVLIGSRTRTGRIIQDTALLKIPVIGGILMGSNMFLLTSNLVTMLDAGVAPIEALRLSGEGLNNVLLHEKLDMVIDEATQGFKLGEAFSKQSVFPPLLSQAIVIGETRGTLADTLRGLSEYYEQQTERLVSGALELIQPAIIIFVAGIVGFVAVGVISGIYSTIGAVQ